MNISLQNILSPRAGRLPVLSWALLGVALFYVPELYGRQDCPVQDPPKLTEGSGRRPARHDGEERLGSRRPGRLGRLPGAQLFRILPEDQGPLSDDERAGLEDFLRQRAPDMFESLQRLRRDQPRVYEEQIQHAAPYLRRLRRICERNPELGDSIIKHSQNLQKLRRMRQAWRENEKEPRTRRRVEELMRQTTAENVAIEIAALEDQIRELEFQREARIKAEYERLTAPEADLSAEPPQTREWIQRLQGRPPRAEEEWLQDELWVVCTERMDVEVEAARRRLERMRGDLAAEVERRMEHLLRAPGAARPYRDAGE